jgi:putative heme-binding domain-containing protein
VGIIATLGASPEAASLEHLRTVYRDEPQYRDPVAMSLAQQPGGDNWAYLVDALRTAEGPAARDILAALKTVPQRPRESAPYRNVILAGLKLDRDGAAEAGALLSHWTGRGLTAEAVSAAAADLTQWQEWYAVQFPDAPPAQLPADAGRDKWSYEELLTFLDSDAGKQGSSAKGAQTFVKAQCATCHRHGAQGETTGPDLTAVARRFQRKEILEAIVYPSHVISDQYASQLVTAGGKTYVGLVTPRDGGGVSVLLSTGKTVELAKDEVEQVEPSQLSVMPTGLLNGLTLEEVADLFAYLNGPGREAVADGGQAPRK